MGISPIRGAVFLAIYLCILATNANAESSSWYSYLKATIVGKSKADEPSHWADVDPSNLVSLILNYGRVVLSDETSKDLQVCLDVCHAEKIELNLVEHHLRLYNVSMSNPLENDGKDHALFIEKVEISWDSYIRPCVSVKVQNVSVSIEFLNVLLTKTNWHTLQDIGFPPKYLSAESNSNSALLVGSVDMSGTYSVVFKSRPLKREIGAIKLNLQMLKELNTEIERMAGENLGKKGRRGCTTDEVCVIMNEWFLKKTGAFLNEHMEDLKSGGMEAKQVIDRLSSVARESVSDYVGNVGSWTIDEAVQAAERKLQRHFGVDATLDFDGVKEKVARTTETMQWNKIMAFVDSRKLKEDSEDET